MKKKPESLPKHILGPFANAVLFSYGFGPVPRCVMIGMYSSDLNVPPYVVYNGKTIVWIDRFYVAVQTEDLRVSYLYISRKHIIEERYAYRICSNARHKKIKIPEDINRQFRHAEIVMANTGLPFYISPKAHGFGVPYIDACAIRCKNG